MRWSGTCKPLPTSTKYRVPVTLKGGPQQTEVKELPKHKKNPDTGLKKTVFSSAIFVEQEDAASFENNEEVISATESLQTTTYIETICTLGHSDGLGERHHQEEVTRTLR